MAELTRNQEIAGTIRSQLGGGTLMMINAKNLVAVEKGLSFKVSCRGTKANYITITLDEGTDTYNFLAQKITGGRWNSKKMERSPIKKKTIKEAEGVYVDMLHELLAEATGLAVRMPRVVGI